MLDWSGTTVVVTKGTAIISQQKERKKFEHIP